LSSEIIHTPITAKRLDLHSAKLRICLTRSNRTYLARRSRPSSPNSSPLGSLIGRCIGLGRLRGNLWVPLDGLSFEKPGAASASPVVGTESWSLGTAAIRSTVHHDLRYDLYGSEATLLMTKHFGLVRNFTCDLSCRRIERGQDTQHLHV
jgi:hypothetical protein